MGRRTRYGTNTGASLAVTLAERQMTQVDLAEAIGKSQPYTNQVLTGRKHPSPEWVDLVASTLKLSAEKTAELHRAAALDNGFKLDLTKP